VLASRTDSIEGSVVDESGHAVSGAQVVIADSTALLGAHESLEGLIAGSRTPSASTNVDGRFRIDGLVRRNYVLNGSRGAQCVRCGRVASGTNDVVLALPAIDRFARLSGRVTTLRGEPIEGAFVHVVPARGAAIGDSCTSYWPGAVTDEAGTFELRDV